MPPCAGPEAEALACLALIVDELCEASADTVHLATREEMDPHWARHVDYLQALRRLAQATLARVPADALA